jgi:hypothetical protein
MSSDESRAAAEQIFKRGSKDPGREVPDFEARAQEVRRKIQYLRELRLAKERDERSKKG